MVLTRERADAITRILNADEERAIKLLSLEPEGALAQINALGNDFTTDELIAYGDALKVATAQGELNADALDGVAGGSLTLAAGAGAFAFGAAIGGAATALIRW